MASPGRSIDAVLAGLAVLMLCLNARSIGAEEPVLARILTIDADQVTLSIEEPDTGAVRRLAVEARALPPGTPVGALVRLWPGASRATSGSLTGARLEPLDSDFMTRDRTGVRARLMYGGQRGFGGGVVGGGSGRGGGTGGR